MGELIRRSGKELLARIDKIAADLAELRRDVAKVLEIEDDDADLRALAVEHAARLRSTTRTKRPK